MRATTRSATVVIALAIGLLSQSSVPEPIRVLLLSGQNNHAWQETTPKLREILERDGAARVVVLDQPETMTAEYLTGFDVILSNWNNWGDTAATGWPDAAQSSLIEFVAGGKGFVSVHAGSSSFYDWADYQKLAITAWDLQNTGHGKQHHFTVKSSGVAHPITEGMADFTTFDELWHKVPVPPEAQVLATAWSDPEFRGTGKEEPILFSRDFGKGRSVNFLLGHHVRAMSHPAFATLLRRGVTWAATGSVPPMPRTLEWTQSDQLLALKLNGATLWQLNFGKDARKPYFHPLALADGPALSWEAPPDHPWHHALWFSWKFINGVNFWEENRDTGQPDGKTLWDAPTITTMPDGAADVQFTLRYEIEPGRPVLEESRTLHVSPPDWLGACTIDWDSTFRASGSDVVLDRTSIEGEPEGKSWGGYAGLSMRFSPMSGAEVNTEAGPVAMEAPQANLDASALDFSGMFDGHPMGLAMLLRTGNDAPSSPWYVIAQPDNNFHYFSPALLYRAPRTLKEGETLSLHYRIVVHPGVWNSHRLLQEVAAMNAEKPKQ